MLTKYMAQGREVVVASNYIEITTESDESRRIYYGFITDISYSIDAIRIKCVDGQKGIVMRNPGPLSEILKTSFDKYSQRLHNIARLA